MGQTLLSTATSIEPILARFQARLSRIFRNVLEKMLVLRLTANDVITGFIKPEGFACLTKELIGYPYGGSFDAFEEFLEILSGERFKQGVNVVGHDGR